MKQLSSSALPTRAALDQVVRVRSDVSEAMTELLEIGARIRPLLIDRKQVGWVRGLHFAERKMIQRMLLDSKQQILHSLQLATSFSREELEACTSLEIQGLSRIVAEMSDRDVSLFPYLSAFTTTSASEGLWWSRGQSLSNYDRHVIPLPGGKDMQLIAAPDHSRLWVSLCTLREQAKQRLDDNFNAAMIVRAQVGKGANSIIGELKGISKTLIPDISDPWECIVKTAVDKNDGWAHTEDSYEGLKREMDAMLAVDKHERLIEKFHAQQYNEAKEKKEKLESMMRDRIPELEERGIEVLSDKDIKQRQRGLRQGRAVPARPAVRPEEREADEGNVQQKMKKYREAKRG